MKENVKLKWLNAHGQILPITWGVPWKKGMLEPGELPALKDKTDHLVPCGCRATAYWPDGSVKWTAHSALLDGTQEYYLDTSCCSQPYTESVRLKEETGGIIADCGPLILKFSKKGRRLFELVSLYGENSHAACGITAHALRTERSGTVMQTRTDLCSGEITGAEIETDDGMHCVVRSCGEIRLSEDIPLLTFILRHYLYAGCADIRVVCSIQWTCPDVSVKLAGLKLDYDVPIDGELYNRHIAFAGEDGLFLEAARLLHCQHDQGARFQREQHQNRPVILTPHNENEEWFTEHLGEAAIWNHYRLNQHSERSYFIEKATHTGCCRIHAHSGSRSSGFLYLCGEKYGVSFSVRDFWQKYPSALSVDGLAENTTAVGLWLWSDEAAPMDFAPYDDRGHGLQFAYEGSSLGSDPAGIGNTSEIFIRFYGQPVTKSELYALSQDLQKDLYPICSPSYYHDSQALGVWGLPDNSAAALPFEHLADSLLQFYKDEIERRSWYGYWNYGDVMHSYDEVRHTWRYDFGGCAWQNTEFAPNLWLWTHFLRSADPVAFRLARSMTRHTSEVDCYHSGPYTGMGSRHNVVHWGCSCKEARIMMAFLHRIFYYLTADERIGEIMEMTVDVDYRVLEKDPMSMYYPEAKQHDIHVRSGPDWTAFASNWITHDERTGEHKYLNKLKKGMDSLSADPIGLMAGPTFLYHPDDGHLHPMGDNNYHYHMIIALGGGEVLFELMNRFPEDKKFQEAVARLGTAYPMAEDEVNKFTFGRVTDKHWMVWTVPVLKIIAFAAAYYQDRELADYAWNMLRREADTISENGILKIIPVPATEWPGALAECIPTPDASVRQFTNNAGQLALTYFQMLELIPPSH
ncbi:exo-rhamnogalacturonan lyase family protein [Lachnotalea sp. AF33-28]|uniref:exo-rhamnogalacturonan lyase family protein n=1 Tax=Lachnotalea sp. AF33-28 TaxID=2292046 RepID=UPI000E4AAE90|nr:hypothetical protein [Lachnotalea sp. AF33-28]RHP36179.1 hypothetical protein DWZ56_00535 [Lachnotalea sp. AF33-28]